MSVTGWYVMALKSGQMAGIEVPAGRHLQSHAVPQRGRVFRRQRQIRLPDQLVLDSRRHGRGLSLPATPGLEAGRRTADQGLPADPGQSGEVQRRRRRRLLLVLRHSGLPSHGRRDLGYLEQSHAGRNPRPPGDRRHEYGSWNPQGDRWGAERRPSCSRPAWRSTCSKSTTGICRSTRPTDTRASSAPGQAGRPPPPLERTRPSRRTAGRLRLRLAGRFRLGNEARKQALAGWVRRRLVGSLSFRSPNTRRGWLGPARIGHDDVWRSDARRRDPRRHRIGRPAIDAARHHRPGFEHSPGTNSKHRSSAITSELRLNWRAISACRRMLLS